VLSSDGLALLHDSMAAHVAAGQLPGLVTLVAHGDELHVDTIGSPSFGGDAPLRRDAIFRIASLTKPTTAAATLSLVDEGLPRLAQPIDELLPELANRRVLREIDAELDDTVPAKRPITIEDLFSYRLGFGSVMAPPGSHPIQRAEAEPGLEVPAAGAARRPLPCGVAWTGGSGTTWRSSPRQQRHRHPLHPARPHVARGRAARGGFLVRRQRGLCCRLTRPFYAASA
jgi:CubicO group peptidase (beta-lactamase class C family)